MQIVVAGVSHRQTALPLRERLAIPDARLQAALSALRQRVTEGFILSTCHRVEVYALCGHESSGTELLRSFLLRGEADTPAARDAIYAHTHDAAVRHALRVAAGLDSMVVGEHQIQAQFRRALGAARRAGMLGPTMTRLGDAALTCGKRVRAGTALGGDAVSLATLAVRVAAGRIAPHQPRVLVLGAGEMAALVARHLPALRPERVLVTSRSMKRAEALAATCGAGAAAWSERDALLEWADVVFTCTAAPDLLVTRAMLASRHAATAGRPILMMDLGVPRDVDPRAAEIPAVSVVHLDELSEVARPHQEAHRDDFAQAEAIVRGETDRFMEWLTARGVAAAIGRVHAHGKAVVEAELARALARLPDLSERDQRVVRDLAQRIVAKMLHHPTVALKQHPEADNLALALEVLLGVPGARSELDARLRPAACEAEPLADDSVA